MQTETAPEHAAEPEAETEGLVLMRKLRSHYGGDDSMALRDACMTVVQLDENVRRLSSHGYRYAGNAYIRGPQIDKKKERVDPIDIAPEQSPNG